MQYAYINNVKTPLLHQYEFPIWFDPPHLRYEVAWLYVL